MNSYFYKYFSLILIFNAFYGRYYQPFFVLVHIRSLELCTVLSAAGCCWHGANRDGRPHSHLRWGGLIGSSLEGAADTSGSERVPSPGARWPTWTRLGRTRTPPASPPGRARCHLSGCRHPAVRVGLREGGRDGGGRAGGDNRSINPKISTHVKETHLGKTNALKMPSCLAH